MPVGAASDIRHAGPAQRGDVPQRDRLVLDRREIAIERECMRVLALYEQIGDLAARIAKRAKKLATGPSPLPIPEALEELAEAALGAVRDALDALARSDARTGRTVIAGDRRQALDCGAGAIAAPAGQAGRDGV